MNKLFTIIVLWMMSRLPTLALAPERLSPPSGCLFLGKMVLQC